jgi:hypothetical protein
MSFKYLAKCYLVSTSLVTGAYAFINCERDNNHKINNRLPCLLYGLLFGPAMIPLAITDKIQKRV